MYGNNISSLREFERMSAVDTCFAAFAKEARMSSTSSSDMKEEGQRVDVVDLAPCKHNKNGFV